MRTAVLIPCYRRPEYTRKCLDALVASQPYNDVTFYLYDDGSCDGTATLLTNFPLKNKVLVLSAESRGLRNIIIDFFERVRGEGYDYLAKMDNDCVVPHNWLDDLIYALETESYDIVSPNVYPSNAAYNLGKNNGTLVWPATHVGGLWCMRASLLNDISFEKFAPNGITGAFNIIKQIIAETDAKTGWVPKVTVDDLGHWSGQHPDHIKSEEHLKYSAEVGRPVSWTMA